MEDYSKEWIPHDSGTCPLLDMTTVVEVIFQNGAKDKDKASIYDWSHSNEDGWDIKCWKPAIDLGKLLKEKIDSMEKKELKVDSDKVNPKQSLGLASLPLHLFSPLAVAYGCIGKLNGKLKYGENNFTNTPVIASIYVDAIKRHLDKWVSGQECDSADGVPHFSAILANVDILISARAAGTLVDDRPSSHGYFEEIESLTPMVTKLQELHKDRNPHHYYLRDQ